ncbi:MAG: HD domain-containing protein [Deltaproteobacteria bacterium]|nr:HD domain-containing protein [Deltaproteobacteria bacterium]
MIRFTDLIDLEAKAYQDKDRGRWAPERDISRIKNVKATQGDNGPSLKEISTGSGDGRKLAKAQSLYKKLLEMAREQAFKVQKGHRLDPSVALPYLRYSIEKGLNDDLYNFLALVHGGRDDLAVHTVVVTFASMKLGKGLEYGDRRILDLGLAAFYQNVGMYKTPPDILAKQGSLTEREKNFIRQHPVISHEILSAAGEEYDFIADIALQVHERFDGSGYPFGLAGEEILEEALVIGLMDQYVAMCSDRPYPKRLMPAEAVKSILTGERKSIAPWVLKAFLEQITLFPVGSLVRLNNQYIGRVISTNEKNPFRPTVELLYDSNGEKMKLTEIIDLNVTPLYYIRQAVDERALLAKKPSIIRRARYKRS